MTQQIRRKFTPQEKVAILRQHLLEGKPVSDVCDFHGLKPSLFYRWQKEFFENGSAAFEKTDRRTARLRHQRNRFAPARLFTRLARLGLSALGLCDLARAGALFDLAPAAGPLRLAGLIEGRQVLLYLRHRLRPVFAAQTQQLVDQRQQRRAIAARANLRCCDQGAGVVVIQGALTGRSIVSSGSSLSRR